MLGFSIRFDNAADQLQTCLDEVSKLSLDPTAEGPSLQVEFVNITPTIVDLLVQILNQPLVEPSPTCTSFKWGHVLIYGCKYSRDDTTGITNNGTCSTSPDDDDDEDDSMRLLGSTLARRVTWLGMNVSPQILECLCLAPDLEMRRFDLTQFMFPERLGPLIQRSVHLTYLDLCLNHLEESSVLVESLGNATQIEDLTISERTYHGQERKELSDEIFTPDRHDFVLRLLQNPQSRLKQLFLLEVGLEDRHLIEIVNVVPFSHLHILDVSRNNIQCEGIAALAAQLPRFTYLKRVFLETNPWERSRTRGGGQVQCWAALFQGLLANDIIEYFGTRKKGQLADFAAFYFDLNWAGRRIFTTSQPVPLGLWPLILQRAGRYKFYHNKLRGPESIFFFLQSSPILSFLCSTSSPRDHGPPSRKSS